MGDWYGTYHTEAIHALRDEQVPDWLAAKLAKKLAAAGVLVSSAYYVPDPNELYGQMKVWQYHLRQAVKCRWVMCRETHDALARKHLGVRAPAPATWVGFYAGPESYPPAPEIETLIAVETHPARLFGVEIRIDPAARSPMFEIDAEATSQLVRMNLREEMP